MEATEGKRSALVPVAGCGCAAVIGLFAIGALVGITSPFMSGGSTYVPTEHTPNEGVPLGQPTAPSILSPPRRTIPAEPDMLILWDAQAESVRVVDGPYRGPCHVTLTRHDRVTGPWCRARVQCGGQLLRGHGASGYYECTLGQGFPSGVDNDTNDSDGILSVGDGGYFSVGGENYYIEGELGHWVAPSLSYEVLEATGDFEGFGDSELAEFAGNTCNTENALGEAELQVRRSSISTGASPERACTGLSPSACICLERELVMSSSADVLGTIRIAVSYSRRPI